MRDFQTDTEDTDIRALSEVLSDLKTAFDGETVSMAAMVEALHERGIGMILLLFSLPMAMPIPVPPGINVMLATPLLLLTAQQALGSHRVWLPQNILKKRIERQRLTSLLDGMIPWMKRIELLVRPRLGWITQDGPSRIFGLLGVVMALTVCIPVPLTNTVPSLGIALMSTGVMVRDGLFVLAGALIGILWVTILVLGVLFFGPEAFDIIKDAIKSILP